MKHIRLLLSDARRHRGLALIIVLSMLALATIVILAFLSVAETENKATNIYSASQASRRYADTAVNLVISQLRAGAARETAGTPVIHATQPGAIRKYAASGNFLGGYKLFSDQNMIFKSNGGGTAASDEEKFVLESEPPTGWNTTAFDGRYVDLNEPVVKGVADGAKRNRATQIFFPIIDPRAGKSMDAAGGEFPVEGFSYDTNQGLGGKDISAAATEDGLKPIRTPREEPNLDMLRLAMPVQWLYVLKDGAVGYLDAQRTFKVLNAANGMGGNGPSVTEGDAYGVPSENNPIVGRVAFWADDESCKVNINTASEPTYAGLPIYYHERDHLWADCPPARSEYQRFPGHPATVALSSVLYPNPYQVDGRSLDTYTLRGIASGGDLDRSRETKRLIYNLAPRIHMGGSDSGTVAFERDSFTVGFGDTGKAVAVEIREAAAERLYASVDELLFDQGEDGNRRVLNPTASGGVSFFNKTTLERASAFLTAHSRASEINLFGLPRVAMWPIGTTTARRTPFDELVRFCTRLGGDENGTNIYVFQREQSHFLNGQSAATHDIGLPRNKALLTMLDNILNHTFPTASNESGSAKSFRTRMGSDNSRQVLVSMFDFIRSTNVYDGFLAPERKDLPTGSNSDWTNMYKLRDSREDEFKTYTVGAIVGNISDPYADRTLPGHGQVTPSIHPDWTTSNNGTIRGFGRFISISEVGLHFICTADGQPDMYSWRIPLKDTRPEAGERDFRIPPIEPGAYDANAVGSLPLISGGRTALRVNEDPNIARYEIVHETPIGFSGGLSAQLVNTRDVRWRTHDNTQNTGAGQIKSRFYSNFPPLRSPNQGGRYGTTNFATPANNPNYARYYQNHPGYNWRNWNWTLDWDTPMAVDEKRIQAMLHLEFFCPSVGYPEIHPDYTVVISSQDISNIEVNRQAIFSTTQSIALRSERPLYSVDEHPETGGFASFRNVAIGRRVGARRNMPQDEGYDSGATGQGHVGLLNLELVSTFFNVKRDQSLEFSPALLTLKIYDHHVSADTTDEPVQILRVRLEQGKAPAPDLVTMGSYNVNYINDQGNLYNHPAIQAPRWWSFSRDGALGRQDVANNAPANVEDAAYRSQRGRLYRWDGVRVDTSTRAYDPRRGAPNNQSVPGAFSVIYGKDGGNYADVEQQTRAVLLGMTSSGSQMGARIGYGPPPPGGSDPSSNIVVRNPDGDYNRPWHSGTDTVRSLVPASGDARLIAAKRIVDTNDWTTHRLWNDENEYMAHNFSSYTAGTEPGFDRGMPLNNADAQSVDLMVRGLPPKVILDGSNPTGKGAGRTPDMPATADAARRMQRYGDFDDSDPGGRVGPFINKVDEGNYSVGDVKLTNWPAAKKWRSTYFRASTNARYASGSSGFFTPNRMVSSPLIMGSLPSNIWAANGEGAWTNLLFRPHANYNTGITGSNLSISDTHPGASSPPDHYLADLFWMPVVEPYAISETFSTAGKINMNYQMLPFTHIRRATALHAAMKGELIAAIPNGEYEQSKQLAANWVGNGSREPRFWSEKDNKFWHRGIVVDRFGPNDNTPWWNYDIGQQVVGTLRQFEERFTFGKGRTVSTADGTKGGLFRTTSQLCELHLIPSEARGVSGSRNVTKSGVMSASDRRTAMESFWSEHAATGDNTRERPYSNLYAKLTTRSNTFRVHVRAQSIRKAKRAVAANVFDPSQDQVGGEFRGSFLIERYLDQTDLRSIERTKIDYAAAQDPFSLKPLENYYRFRVLESKRFAP